MSLAADISELVDAIVAAEPGNRLDVAWRAGTPDAMAGPLADAAVAIATEEPARALAVTEALLEIVDASRDAAARARARRARARALSYAARFEDALVVCDDAIAIAERGGAMIEAARARLASIHALGELGRLDRALEVVREARMIFEQSDAPALAARADINLGIIHQRREEPEDALACFDRARPALAGDALMLGNLDNNRGEALLAVNAFDRAQEAFEAALAIFRIEGARMPAAIAEGNLADLAARQGRLGRAMHWFERARRSLEDAGAPAVAARVRAEQADAKTILGLPMDAVTEYEDALEALDRHGLAIEAARARCGLGRALSACDRRADATTALAAAATAFEDLGRPAARAQVDLVRSELALRNGQAADARRLAARALATLIEQPADAAHARLVLARAAMATGDHDTARADLAAALVVAKRLDLAPLLADMLTVQGDLDHRCGRLDDAVTALAEAIHQVDRLRGSLQAERSRAAFLGGRTAAHALMVRVCLDRNAPGDARRALHAIERARSRSLLDRVDILDDAHADRRALHGPDAELQVRLADARAQLSAIYSRMGDAAERESSLREWSATVRAHEEVVTELEHRLAAGSEGAAQVAAVAGADSIRMTLAHHERLVSWFTDGDDLVSIVVSRDGIVPRRMRGAVPHVTHHLERFGFQAARAMRPGAMEGPRAERMTADARRELEAIAEPLAETLAAAADGARRLIFVPHGVMHLVPFAALPIQGIPLLDSIECVSVPSASLLVALRAQPPRRGAKALVVGIDDDDAPGMAAEAQRIAARIPDAVTLIGEDATSDRFAHALTDAQLVHIAAHGRFDPARPQASGVRLADRWFTVVDTLRERLPAELVVLSGCETGVNRVMAGDELDGLLRAYFTAGARRVLTTLWPVHDTMTTTFADALYRDGAPLENTAARVRSAMLATRAACPHPAFWAPFTLSGAP